MRVKCNQVVSDAIRAGRKRQKVTQARSAAAIGISRTKLALMEVDGAALGAASFFSVLKAIQAAGLELHLIEKPAPKTLDEIQVAQKLANQQKLETV
ncbi:MAG: hypothetical protein NTY69_10765 [Methylococcales bacterium]|nr:hypothetical protein [Methylococcales bacterium]